MSSNLRSEMFSAFSRAGQEVSSACAAYAAFCDDVYPLPKYSAVPLKLSDGNQFPDLYFRGAALMRAFALLGEALAKEPSARR